MMRLRTGHCRLEHQLHTKLLIGDKDTCLCGMAPMTVEHLLQDCTTHQNERKATWPTEKPVKETFLAYWRICGTQRPSYEEQESLSERSTKKKYPGDQ